MSKIAAAVREGKAAVQGKAAVREGKAAASEGKAAAREVRALPAIELRVVGEGAAQKISGYAALYNSLSEDLGGFRERILPGAFDAVLGGDVMGRYNHELILGRTVAGTMALSADQRGLRYEITPGTSAPVGHVVEAIRRGDVRGSSFAFNVDPGGENWMKEGDTIVRELRSVSALYDVGPVDNPAYPDTNGTVAMRALDKVKELRAGGMPVQRGGAGIEIRDDATGAVGVDTPELPAAVATFKAAIAASRALVDALTARAAEASADEVAAMKEAARYAWLCQDEVGDAIDAIWPFISPYDGDYYRSLATARELRGRQTLPCVERRQGGGAASTAATVVGGNADDELSRELALAELG